MDIKIECHSLNFTAFRILPVAESPESKADGETEAKQQSWHPIFMTWQQLNMYF